MINVTIPPEFGKGGSNLTDQDATGLKAILQAIIDAIEEQDRIIRNRNLTLTTTTTTTTTASTTTVSTTTASTTTASTTTASTTTI